MSVESGQEGVRRPLPCPIDTGLDRVCAANVGPVILPLPGVHNPPLRGVGGRTKTQEPRRHGNICECGVDRRLIGNGIPNGVASKFDRQAAITHAGFVDHRGRKNVGPTQAKVLSERGNIVRITLRGGGKAVSVGVCFVLVQPAPINAIGVPVHINANKPIVLVEECGQRAFNPTHLYRAGDQSIRVG